MISTILMTLHNTKSGRIFYMTQGEKITVNNGVLNVQLTPIIPFTEGDGTGPDICAVSRNVIEAAVDKPYDRKKSIDWEVVYAGQKTFDKTGEWLSKDTLDKIDEY